MSKRDIALVLGVLLVAAIVFFMLRSQRKAPVYAVIYVQNEVYARVPLDEPQTVCIDQGGGKVNVVAIDEYGVHMESSTCKNQLCVQQGTLGAAHGDTLPLENWIVCLPNGVTVELASGEDAP